MKGMRVVVKLPRQHHRGSPLVGLVARLYSSLPEPPATGNKGRSYGSNLDFIKKTSRETRYQPVISRTGTHTQSSKPFFHPTKENLETTLKELSENCEISKVHRLLSDNYLLQPEQAKSLFELAESKKVATAKTHSLLIIYYAKQGKQVGEREGEKSKCSAGDIEAAKQALSEAEQAKMQIEPGTALVLVALALDKHDTTLADRMFRSLSSNRDLGFHAYRHMIRHYYFASRLNEFDATVMELINNKIRIPHDDEARTFIQWLLRALHKLGRTAAISQLYREVRTTGLILHNDVYNLVIRSVANEGSSELKQLVQDMKSKNVIFDSSMYHRKLFSVLILFLPTLFELTRYYPLLRGLNRHETEYAKQLGDEMLAGNFPLDMRTYNAYLHVCVRHMTPTATADAIRVYERIKAAGLVPDMLTYTNLLKACGQVGDVATCDTLLQDLLASGVIVTQDSIAKIFHTVPTEVSFKLLQLLKDRGIQPDVVAYNMLLTRTDSESAQHVLQLIEADNIQKDSVTYNTLMGVYGKSRNTQKCKELLQEMDEKGIVADVWAYNAMIPALEITDTADALVWLREVRGRGCQPDEVTYNSLINNLLRKSKKSFVPLWEDMVKHKVPLSVYTYNLYVKARGQAGEVDACEPLLHEMRALELQPDVVTYTTCFDFISDINTLQRLHEDMINHNIAPGVPSYVSLLRQSARADEHKWAGELLEAAKTRGLISQRTATELQQLTQYKDGFMQMPEKLLDMYNNGTIKQ